LVYPSVDRGLDDLIFAKTIDPKNEMIDMRIEMVKE
jgi:hypothetical protein